MIFLEGKCEKICFFIISGIVLPILQKVQILATMEH